MIASIEYKVNNFQIAIKELEANLIKKNIKKSSYYS